MQRRLFLLLAALILAGAAFHRLYDLHRFPPGLHYDEAADMLLSRDIAFFGYRPFPVVNAYSGREALFYYVAAPMLRVVGPQVMATRLTSAFLGILAVAVTIALGKSMLRSGTAGLLAGAWLTVNGAQIWLSRQGFRTSPQPVLEALALWLLWIALNRTRRWTGFALLAGVFAGAALYVYMAARIFPLWLLLPLGFLLIADTGHRTLRIRQLIAFFGALLVTASPIVVYYAANWTVFTDRLTQLAPGDSTITVSQSIALHLEMFFLRGDPLLRYNLAPGRPFFDLFSGCLMLVGIGMALLMLWRRSAMPIDRTRALFVLLSPLLVIPSVLAVGGLPPSHLRSVAMVPLIFFLPALGAIAILRALRLAEPWPIALAVLLFLGLGGAVLRDYQSWGSRTDLFYDSDGDLQLAARWLETNAQPNDLIYIASKYYEHPTVLAHRLDSGRIRWMMDDHLLWPPMPQPAILIFPRTASVHPWRSYLNAAQRIDSLPVGPDGLPAFEAYRLPGVPIYWEPTDTSINVGNMVELIDSTMPPAIAGEAAELRLTWRINSAGRDGLTPIISITDKWGEEVTRVMPYFEQTGRWLAGELLLQRVSFTVPRGNPPGSYQVRVAWVDKTRQDAYLPVLDDEQRFAGVWASVETMRLSKGQSIESPALGAVPFLPSVVVQHVTPMPERIGQGERLKFTVTWLATASLQQATPLRLVLRTADGNREAELWRGDPVRGTYPMTRWSAGEQVLDRYDIQIPPDLAPGTYRLELITDIALNPALSASLNVTEVVRRFDAPNLPVAVDYRFGESITLIGYEITAIDADQIRVTLAWRATTVADRDYTVFVHVMGSEPTPFSQIDVSPSRPTSQWIPREVIVDSYTLKIPPGSYRVSVGLYLQDSGARLPVSAADGTPYGDALDLPPP